MALPYQGLISAIFKDYRRQRFSVHQEGLVYQCPLNFRKKHNLATQEINKRFLKWHEFSFPHILHVGVTTYCNLSCPGCPTGTTALGRPKKHLQFDTFTRAVDGLRNSLIFMLFWDWGEPLLHPRISDMIQYAKRSDIKTVISTNGTIGNSTHKIEQLVASQPDVITVCVDGANQETYERYRVGGKLDAVIATLERLAEAKRKLRVKYPVVDFRVLSTKYTVRQLPALLEMAERTGSNLLSLKTLRPHNYHGCDIDEEFVPTDLDLARYQYLNGRVEPEDRIYDEGPLMCGKPVYAPTLNSDGMLTFCSYASKPEEFYGDVSQDGFRKVWKSRKSREKRSFFLKKEGTYSCTNCYFRSAHKPTIVATIPLTAFPSDISLQNPLNKKDFLRLYSARPA